MAWPNEPDTEEWLGGQRLGQNPGAKLPSPGGNPSAASTTRYSQDLEG